MKGKKYVKKRIEVEAWKFRPEFPWPPGVVVKYEKITDTNYYVTSLEGDMRLNPGDYVVRGIKGEMYVCRGDIFEESYDPVDPTKHDRDPGNNKDKAPKTALVKAATNHGVLSPRGFGRVVGSLRDKVWKELKRKCGRV